MHRLYAGDEYTKTRLVKHTLMHYKSFERLLVARIGPSIARRLALADILARGGATVAAQVRWLPPLASQVGSIIIFLCVLSQLGVGDAWDAGRATSP